MEQNEITEGNKLIAEFLEIELCDRCDGFCGKFKYGAGIYFSPSQMKYHTSWDWLMPVVENIEDNHGVRFEIGLHTIKIMIANGYDDVISPIDVNMFATKLQAVCSAVIQFITYYNKTIKSIEDEK